MEDWYIVEAAPTTPDPRVCRKLLWVVPLEAAPGPGDVDWSSMTRPMSLGLLKSDSRLEPGLEPELLRLEGPLPVPPT